MTYVRRGQAAPTTTTVGGGLPLSGAHPLPGLESGGVTGHRPFPELERCPRESPEFAWTHSPGAAENTLSVLGAWSPQLKEAIALSCEDFGSKRTLRRVCFGGKET